MKENSSDQESAIIKELLAKIEFLKGEIAKVQAQINAILNRGNFSCNKILNNLSLNSTGTEVSCLQEVLKSQGSGIYPEGIVSGYFGNLTRMAVIKFPEKYASEILTPSGFSKGTGFVGPATRAKINQILGR